MGLAATLARRNLLQRPGRTAFSVLGVAVGIATVVCIFTMDHNTILERTSAHRRHEPGLQADLEVRAPRGERGVEDDLRSLPGVSDVAAHFQNDAKIRVGADEADPEGDARQAPRKVRLVAMEARMSAWEDVLYVERGRPLDPEAEGREALVGEALARLGGVEVGDRIWLSRAPRVASRVCVEGELTTDREVTRDPIEFPFEVVGVLADESVGRKSSGQVVVIDYAVGLEMFEGAHVERLWSVQRDPTVDVERLEASLGKTYSYELRRSVIVGQKADERAFRNGVRFAGLLAMVLGLFVIFHTLSMSLIERVREVGVLHALGATRPQIARIFFGEALFVALSAGVLGLAGGLGLAAFLLRRGISTLGVGARVLSFDVPWTLVGPLTLVGVGIALLGSVFPLLRARETDVVAALRGEDPGDRRTLARGFQVFSAILLLAVLPGLYFVIVPVVGEVQGTLVGVVLAGVGILALLLGLPLVAPGVMSFLCSRLAAPFEERWPLAGKLAGRSIRQSPSRISASVAAIAIVTASFVGLKGMTASLRAEVETWGERAVADKVFVSDLPDVPLDDVIARLERYPGVLGVEPSDARTYVPYLLIGLRTGELESYGPLARDPGLARTLREEQGVILSERLARHHGYRVGEFVHVNTTGHGVQSFPVVAVSDEYGYFPEPEERMYGVVDERWMERYFCLDTETTSSFAVRLGEGADPLVVEAAVRDLLPGATGMRTKTGSWVVGWHLRDIDRDFVLFDIILGLTALLAALGVLNGQLLVALERAKELGVLRALGMTRSQVAGMVTLECAAIGVTGGGLGLLLGGALTPVIVSALEVISGLPLPQRTAGAWLALSLGGALVLTLLSGLYPIWRMNRFDAVRAVRSG